MSKENIRLFRDSRVFRVSSSIQNMMYCVCGALHALLVYVWGFLRVLRVPHGTQKHGRFYDSRFLLGVCVHLCVFKIQCHVLSRVYSYMLTASIPGISFRSTRIPDQDKAHKESNLHFIYKKKQNKKNNNKAKQTRIC